MKGLRAYVRCTLDGGRSGGGRRHLSDVPIPDLHYQPSSGSQAH